MKSLLIFLLFLVGCSDSQLNLTGPTEDIEEGPGLEAPELASRNRISRDFSEYRGLTAFAFNLRSQAEQSAFIIEAQGLGYNILRIPSETHYWNRQRSLLFSSNAGPAVSTDEWNRQLRQSLNVTRDMNIWVELVVVFTAKTQSLAEQVQIARRVARLLKAGDYKHVVVSSHNEWYTQTSRSTAQKVINVLREELGARYLITIDDAAVNRPGEQVWKFGPFRGISFPSLHPWRNPSPTLEEYFQAPRAFMDESVAYASDEYLDRFREFRGAGTIALLGRGTELERRTVVRRDFENCIEAGHGCLIHSLQLVDTVPGFWAPRVSR